MPDPLSVYPMNVSPHPSGPHQTVQQIAERNVRMVIAARQAELQRPMTPEEIDRYAAIYEAMAFLLRRHRVEMQEAQETRAPAPAKETASGDGCSRCGSKDHLWGFRCPQNPKYKGPKAKAPAAKGTTNSARPAPPSAAVPPAPASQPSVAPEPSYRGVEVIPGAVAAAPPPPPAPTTPPAPAHAAGEPAPQKAPPARLSPSAAPPPPVPAPSAGKIAPRPEPPAAAKAPAIPVPPRMMPRPRPTPAEKAQPKPPASRPPRSEAPAAAPVPRAAAPAPPPPIAPFLVTFIRELREVKNPRMNNLASALEKESARAAPASEVQARAFILATAKQLNIPVSAIASKSSRLRDLLGEEAVSAPAPAPRPAPMMSRRPGRPRRAEEAGAPANIPMGGSAIGGTRSSAANTTFLSSIIDQGTGLPKPPPPIRPPRPRALELE